MIERQVPESDWHAAWEAAAFAWVGRIRDSLGGEYQLYQTENFLILSAAPARIIRDACRSFEDALRQILSLLDGVALDQGHIREFIAAVGVGLTSQYLEQFGRKLIGGLLGKAAGRALGLK